MIRKTFNKIAEKTFVNKTKAHAIQPKALNLHFPNAINPEFKFLNLTNLSAISFSIRTIKKESDKDEFALTAQLSSYTDNNVKNMDIAVFKSEEEANTALNDIRVALYMPSKSFAKWVAVLGVICGLVCMGHLHMKGMNNMHGTVSTTNNSPMVSNTAPTTAPVGLPMMGMPPSQDMPPPVDNAEIDKIISQLQEVKQLQAGGTPSPEMLQQMQQAQGQPQQQQQPPRPVEPAEQFLNGLN